MKVHYINILLFTLPLNILVHYQRNHNNTKYHTSNTKPTKTYRTLCECELYSPSKYDNDPEMKEVMENFNRLTSQRFREYEERMEDKRKQCKEQYDKETQQIILKEKIQKELTEKLSALQTNTDTNDIPTCACEKSAADKVENTFLKCGGILGTAVPELGLIGGNALYAISLWKDAEIVAAIAAAQKAGTVAGIKAGHAAGVKAVISGLKSQLGVSTIGNKTLGLVLDSTNYTDISSIVFVVNNKYHTSCLPFSSFYEPHNHMCTIVRTLGHVPGNLRAQVSTLDNITKCVKDIVTQATNTADTVTASETTRVSTLLQMKNTSAIETTCASFHVAIMASIFAIVVIVLFMVIIYLILRYRRKKKIRKKLQYIKLLKE
ncbi:PIR protein [Plasmodium sp.]|nr:PIR protein [Plasmodium sp.]